MAFAIPESRALPRPYYEADGITLYHGDCREILPLLEVPALTVADPPYGQKERTARGKAGRGHGPKWDRPARDFPPVIGDDKPYDPTPLLSLPRVIIFGAQRFADRLPVSPSWIVWDKRDGGPSDDNGDCEMAWSNIGGPPRLFSHKWRGLVRASENGRRSLHPTQKPVVLGEWILGRWTQPGDLVVEPYLGAGFICVAAKKMGRRAIGIEMEERYCEVVADRLSQRVLNFGSVA